MDKFLTGKRALVTGGSRGIGRAIAKELAMHGADVAICGRSAESVSAAVTDLSDGTGGKVVGRSADIGSDRQVAELFRFVDAELGGLDILVNNAGIGVFGPVGEMSVDDWRRTIDTNLSGVFYCCREAIPRFRNAGGGFVVNISSLAGKNPFSRGGAYNASKFGLNGFTEAMMMDHRYDNIRVSYVMPGSVETEFSPGVPRADWKIAPEDIAEIVLSILRMPERTLISRVEVRPSKPQK
ncbi:MAG: SDR family oxidoreductase [Bryobacteraceae bacterium]|nr:SDR family oxidoreductase [Bryobacteraceae bacterium]